MAELEMRELWYDDVLVGRIRDALLSDGTWFGMLQLTLDSQSGELPRRLLEFIRFCEDWNERARGGVADLADFKGYSDLMTSGLWVTKDSTGRSARIAEAPAFFGGHEVTWSTV